MYSARPIHLSRVELTFLKIGYILYLGEWAIASHGMYESHQVFGAAESGKYEMIPPVHSYNLGVCSSKSIQWLLRYEGFGLMAKTLYA